MSHKTKPMKKILLTVFCLFVITLSFSQKKERIKGSKNVVILQKKIEPFTQLEVLNDIEINLIKGDKCGVELEADDNLQDVLDLRMNGSMLIVSFAKEVISSKKINIRVTYTDDLDLISAKEQSKITALESIKLDMVNIKAVDNAKLFLNIDAKNCTISANDKVQIELNSKAETLSIDLSKNAELKALVSANTFKCDLYQNAKAKIEGDVINMVIRIENNSNFDGRKLNSKKADVTVEDSANCFVNCESTVTISAAEKAEIDLYGDAKIDLQKFAGTAILRKKIGK